MKTYDFSWEPLSTLLDDGLERLVEQHWQEVGVHKGAMPLACDWERYFKLEEGGILKTMGARTGEDLVGYASFIVGPHLHYMTTPHALNDGVYVLPEYRGVGLQLIRAAERALAELVSPKAIRIIYHAKLHVEQQRGSLARVFEHLGYRTVETLHEKFVRV